MTTPNDREVLDRVSEGFRRVGLSFPYLVGLIQQVDAQLDARVPTMGIFPSGRLLVNPQFVGMLSDQDLVFVLAHELYHLVLRTHDRSTEADARDFNIAHDYIINDILREELQATAIPAGGLDWRGARNLSAEKILADMERNPASRPPQLWNGPSGQPGGGGRGDPSSGGNDPSQGQGAGQGPQRDVLDSATEREMFPDTATQEQQERMRAVHEQAARGMSLKAIMDASPGQGRGSEAGGANDAVSALRGLYRPPWELALQRWLESVAPGDRTYARPSRRGADRKDLVLPGRKRESWSLHIILDTSGSMVEEIPKALGAIADFCQALGVEEVHLIQCDTEVGRDEVLAPADMVRWQITGQGGSDLTPAMLRLAEDVDVQSALVLTDGDIDYPQTPMPYTVLWVLPAWKNPADFTPRYGKVIGMTQT